MTTKKSTKTTKATKKDAKCEKCIDPVKYRDMLIVALIAMIVGITAAFTLHIQSLKTQLDNVTCVIVDENAEEVEE